VDLLQEMEPKFQRNVAHKLRIKDILEAEYIKTEGFTSNYLNINNKEVSKVNIIGVVVQKSGEGNYKTIMVDDGSGYISARVFDDSLSLDNFGLGDVITIIGKPREFSSEKYILIEIVKKVDPNWARARKIELGVKETPVSSIKENNKLREVQKEVLIEADPKNKILKLIKRLDSGQGVSIEDIPKEETKEIGDIDPIISLLLREGDIFEIKPGKLKVLE